MTNGKKRPKAPRNKRNAPIKSPAEHEDIERTAKAIHACLRSEGASIVAQQFEAGRHILTLHEDAKHGKGVSDLAVKLKRTPKSLYRLMDRARAFTPEGITTAIAIAAGQNYILSVKIFDALVALPDSEEPQQWLEEAIKEHWTVQQLRLVAWGPEPKSAQAAASVSLRQVIRRSQSLMTALKGLATCIDDAGCLKDGGRALATLGELSLAMNAVTQRLSTQAHAKVQPSPTSTEEQ